MVPARFIGYPIKVLQIIKNFYKIVSKNTKNDSIIIVSWKITLRLDDIC